MADSSRYGRNEVEEPTNIKYIVEEGDVITRFVHQNCHAWRGDTGKGPNPGFLTEDGPRQAVPLDEVPGELECPRCHKVLPTEREQ